MEPFNCEACGHFGSPNVGIEVNDDPEPGDERRYVSCEECGARHEVGVTVLDGERYLELGRLFPEDAPTRRTS